MNVVKLNILPGGDVADRVGIFLGQIAQHAHLLGIHPAKWQLDAKHARRVPVRFRPFGQRGIGERLLGDAIMAMAVIVALAIGSATKALLGKDAVFDLTLLAQVHLGFKIIDIACPVFADASLKFFFPSNGH